MSILSRLSIIFLLASLTGCGTIGARRSIVAIDSNPRGAQVHDQSSQLLGTTPFFMQKEKQLHERFTFSYRDEKKSESYFCSINWSESVVPNLVPSLFFPLGMVVSGGFLLTDWATGDIYRCDDALIAKLSSDTSTQTEVPRLLILPPNLDDHQDAKSFAEKVVAEREIQGKIVKWSRGEEVLEYFDINPKRSAEIKTIPQEHWREVAFRTHATKLLYFEQKDEQFIPVEMDLVTFDEKRLPAITYRSSKTYRDYFASLFSFFPNALTLSHMTGISGTSVDDPSNNHVSKHPEALPKFLSWWGAENISNPRLLSPWDVELQFSPLIAFPAFRYQDGDYWINGQRYFLGYEGGLTFHSPFGALRLGYALGPSVSRFENSSGEKGSNFHWLTSSFSASYYAFLTERLYFKISLQSYGFQSQEYQGKLDDLTVTMVSIGYYIPHLKWKLRQVISF